MLNDKDICTFFDECARNCFMREFSSEEEGKLHRLFEKWNIMPGQAILEPGCGSGRLSERLAESVGPDGMVYAFDISEEMIRNAKDRNPPETIRFVCGSADRIDIEDNYFDKAICFNVFPHFSHPLRMLSEINRVLKTGGDLWINHLKERNVLNELHKNASSTVIANDIPDDYSMCQLLERSGYEVIRMNDNNGKGYSFHAVKSER
ncbi:2-methoxy-6-polyprenyl-1,4-benzoquinol methylase, mitochondrial [subsurface metagenome]